MHRSRCRSDSNSEQLPHALLYLPLQFAPKTLFQLADEMLELLGDGCYLRHGCKSPFENGFSCSGQSQLTPSRLLHNRSYVTDGSQRIALNF